MQLSHLVAYLAKTMSWKVESLSQLLSFVCQVRLVTYSSSSKVSLAARWDIFIVPELSHQPFLTKISTFVSSIKAAKLQVQSYFLAFEFLCLTLSLEYPWVPGFETCSFSILNCLIVSLRSVVLRARMSWVAA